MGNKIDTGQSKKGKEPVSSLRADIRPIFALEDSPEYALSSQTRGGMFLIVSIDRGDSLAIGNTIIEVDRELRRTINISQHGQLTADSISEELRISSKYYAETEALGPHRNTVVHFSSDFEKNRTRNKATKPTSEVSTHLIAFEPGSGHLLFEIVGHAIDLFSNQPLSAVLNVVALSQGARWAGIRVRKFRHRGANNGPIDMLNYAAENNGNLEALLGPPVQEASLGQVTGAARPFKRTSYMKERMNHSGTVIERETTTIEEYS